MTESLTMAGPSAAARVGWLGQLGWGLADASRSPYIALGTIFIFSAYFTGSVASDPIQGQATWSYVASIIAVLLALGGPVAGAVADAGGRRKPWIAACILLGAPAMAALWYATPAMGSGLGWIVAALVCAGLAVEFSAIFLNAMLPNVASPGRLGFLSGLGFALGNFTGIALFLFFLFAWSWNPHPLFGLDPAAHEPERAIGPMAAICLVAMSLPLFLVTPDSPSNSRSVRQALGSGLGNLARTIRGLGNYRNIAVYLVARMIFNEGFIVLMMFTGVFAAGLLHWTATMLTAEGLINSVVAVLGALFAGWLDDRIGSKASCMLFVACCLVITLVLVSVTDHSVFFVELATATTPPRGLFPTLPDKVFLVDQAAAAFFVTGGFVSSRSLMARLAPTEMLNEFFGLYALSGTATSFLGPLAIGLLTTLFHNQRAGVSVGIFFFLAGLAGLSFVRVERAVAKH